MKKKVLIYIAMLALLTCALALCVSAAAMTNYCTVDLTLTNGETVTAYCVVSGGQMKRDNLYKEPDTESEKYNWEDIVIFDCRNQEVVGGSIPRAFVDTGCNSLAKNVKEVYLPEHFTYFLNTTFTSGWTSLETVYIPAAVTEIKGFGSSPVKNVIIAENSQLKTIGGDAFNNCTKLENIDISKCSNLKTIGGNAFRSCTSLKTIVFPDGLESIERNGFYLAGIGGTIVVPNSVKTLKEGAFLATQIETLILGDGPVTIGYNFLGSTGNKYLKNVYISAEAVITSTNTFYKCANSVNFYIVGEDCEALKTVLLGQQGGYYMPFIDAADVTESTGAGYGIIYTNVNRCEVFYGNEHEFDPQASETSCIVQCTRCKSTVESGGEHEYGITEEFLGEKFTSDCVVTNGCAVCGKVYSQTTVGVIISCLGYSSAEFGANGIILGFTVSREAIAAYESATGKTVNYGVFAVSKAKLGDNDVFNADGEAASGVLSVDLTHQMHSMLEMKITGFTDATKDSNFAMGAYTRVTKDDTSTFSYIQKDAPTDGEKYNFISYSAIANS